MKRMSVLVVMLLILPLFLQGCGDAKSDSKSMAQLHTENGIPVRVSTVEYQSFSSGSSYDAVMSGIEESSAFSMISDKIESIHYKVGDSVKKDAVVLEFPTSNPAAQYYQTKVAFEHAKSSFDRVENLFQSGGISRQERDNAKTQLDVAQANWDAVQKSVKVEAPISGIITQILVRESDNVSPGDKLFTISKTNKMKAKIWVPEKDISQFKMGLPATAYWQGKTLNGKLVQIDLALNKDQQAFGVQIEFDNSKNELISGVTAEIIVSSYSSEKSIVIDRKNIIQEENANYVYVAQNGVAVKKQVKTGNTSGVYVEIKNGLSAGDQLITEGQILLADGKKIQIIN